jgi:SAM-dependent methyltransferase
MTMGVIEQVRALYEDRPYPRLSLLEALSSRISRDSLPLLHYPTLFRHSYGTSREPTTRAKILVAGAGTFEPLAVAAANPGAEIWAVDLSERSLAKLRWLARLRGVKLHICQANILALPSDLSDFDYVIATGVLHHMPDAEIGLRALQAVAKPEAIFRILFYSRRGRELLYATKDLIELAGANSPQAVRELIAALPAGHPYSDYFHLYSDAENDTGLADGYLHPCDRPLSALDMEALLARVGLEARVFLHGPEGQPDNPILGAYAQALGLWQRIEALDLLGELQENFTFVAGSATIPRMLSAQLRWCPLLVKRGEYYSKLLGKSLFVDKNVDPGGLNPMHRKELERALFLY